MSSEGGPSRRKQENPKRRTGTVASSMRKSGMCSMCRAEDCFGTLVKPHVECPRKKDAPVVLVCRDCLVCAACESTIDPDSITTITSSSEIVCTSDACPLEVVVCSNSKCKWNSVTDDVPYECMNCGTAMCSVCQEDVEITWEDLGCNCEKV